MSLGRGRRARGSATNGSSASVREVSRVHGRFEPVRGRVPVSFVGTMTDHERPVGQGDPSVEPMDLYRAYWISGGTTGEIVDFAPDADTLAATIRANPSRFGIPCQSMILG